ncbi:MAG: serine/threonine protein kinase [Deltaproteobacteria bacterium]|nr:serine/threonine protein kinase [Deltaproteobacteria bacterium]
MTSIKELNLDYLIGQEVGTATILKELARGGSAIVFVAFQRTLKRQIAVKILPKVLLTADTAERFQREAESAAILSHPNIIQIYEVGATDDFLFFAMQLVHGKSLAEYLKAARKHVLPSRRILPVKTTIDIMRKVLDALDYAHHQDIIHRDIKPGNVLFETHSKRPIVLDFGIAKTLRGPDEDSSVIQGTPVYMAPEQILNEVIDGRTDVYAAGLMLFEMLVSKLPMPPWDSARSLLQMKLDKKDQLFLRKPSELNKAIHPDLDEIVLKAVSFYPDTRFPDCREFLERLEEYNAEHLRN